MQDHWTPSMEKKKKKKGYSKPVLFLIFNKAFLSMTIIR